MRGDLSVLGFESLVRDCPNFWLNGLTLHGAYAIVPATTPQSSRIRTPYLP